jgi:hypothetical protein
MKQPNVAELVCVGIDRGEQPVTLVVDVDPRFVDRGPIRLDVAIGL